jgi:hypothetical protein
MQGLKAGPGRTRGQKRPEKRAREKRAREQRARQKEELRPDRGKLHRWARRMGTANRQ